MFCEKCGAELKEDWKICPNCGTPVPEENDEPIQAPNNNHKNNKWIIIGIVAVIIVVVVAAFTVFGKKETKSKVPKESKKTETEETDFSKQDLEDLIGKTAEDVKKTGLVEMGDSGEFEGLSGSITVRIEDGQVNYIAITGDKAKAPTFHGVSLGMTEEEANSKLADTYSQASNQTDNIRVYNSDKKASVYLGFTNGKVDSITYRPMEDTEAQNDQAQEYIFPDSDKKYLSEDEVRSVDESQLSLGRNEIFARHGYIFNDDSINQYFKGKSWYQGTVPADQFDMDSVFNDFEKKNVELIKKVENEVNGTSSQANNAEQQEAIQDTYDALIGVWYQYKDSEMAISFRNSNTLEVQYGGEQENKFFNYTVTARYEVYRYGRKKVVPDCNSRWNRILFYRLC